MKVGMSTVSDQRLLQASLYDTLEGDLVPLEPQALVLMCE